MSLRIPFTLLLALQILGCQTPPSPEISTSAEPPKPPAPASVEPELPKEKRIFQLEALATVKLQAPKGKLEAWVMDDNAKRQEGMMWLTDSEVPGGMGMVFVFPEEANRSFWMANTLIPLDIAYLDAKGKVVNVVRGEPESEQSLRSEGPSKYVIELKAGDAEKYGLAKGSRVRFPPGLTSAD